MGEKADKPAVDHTPHLYNTKSAFAAYLKSQPAHEHPALAAKHGWRIVDLTCQCGLKVRDHVIDTRSSVGDDLRVKPCVKCGARGQWTWADAVKPAAPKPQPVVPPAPQAPEPVVPAPEAEPVVPPAPAA